MPDNKAQYSVWNNWTTVQLCDKDMLPPDAVKDSRSGFFCIDDAMTLDAYAHYLHVFMGYVDYAKDASGKSFRRPIAGPVYMRQLGFVPISAFPSYWPKELVQEVVQQFKQTKIPIYTRPYIGTTDTIYENKMVGQMPDWWISKLDISERMRLPLGSIGVKEVFQSCGITALS